MTPLRSVYLGLAARGAVHPMYWFVSYMAETGTGLSGLIEAWHVNASTTGLDHGPDLTPDHRRHRANGLDRR